MIQFVLDKIRSSSTLREAISTSKQTTPSQCPNLPFPDKRTAQIICTKNINEHEITAISSRLVDMLLQKCKQGVDSGQIVPELNELADELIYSVLQEVGMTETRQKTTVTDKETKSQVCNLERHTQFISQVGTLPEENISEFTLQVKKCIFEKQTGASQHKYFSTPLTSLITDNSFKSLEVSEKNMSNQIATPCQIPVSDTLLKTLTSKVKKSLSKAGIQSNLKNTCVYYVDFVDLISEEMVQHVYSHISNSLSLPDTLNTARQSSSLHSAIYFLNRKKFNTEDPHNEEKMEKLKNISSDLVDMLLQMCQSDLVTKQIKLELNQVADQVVYSVLQEAERMTETLQETIANDKKNNTCNSKAYSVAATSNKSPKEHFICHCFSS